MNRFATAIFTMSMLLVGLTACTVPLQYRTMHPEPCVSTDISPAADSECEKHALQELPGNNGNSFLLGFIEFDDQGQLWDRTQMHDVLTRLREEAAQQELLMVVFVHGWKHSAAPGDSNIDTFRGVLASLSDAETYLARLTGLPARKVTGVYLGWRGGSIPIAYVENITFWDRKNTAQKVGHGGVTEVLSQLEDIKRSKDSIACADAPDERKATCASNTRYVVVGHSFGGAVVHTALAQILANRFVQTRGPAGTKSDVAGFGNLVVLINPAFEANLFTPLSDMAAERTFFGSQLPVLLILTSEDDLATRYAFPIGRWFSTLFEREPQRQRLNRVTGETESISGRDANITAIGHFEPYRTHRLYPTTERKRKELTLRSTADSVQLFLRSSQDWFNDKPGSKIPFGDVTLERTANSAGRNPYLVTYVDEQLIEDHNDIDDPRVIEFIKQLILISSYDLDQTRKIRASFKATSDPAGKPR